MKRNKIVILYKKGPPVFNDPIWHLKVQYAMILLPIGTENCFSRWQKEKETFHTVIWTGRIKNPPETRIFPADFIIRITQVQAYRRPQHGSRI